MQNTKHAHNHIQTLKKEKKLKNRQQCRLTAIPCSELINPIFFLIKAELIATAQQALKKIIIEVIYVFTTCCREEGGMYVDTNIIMHESCWMPPTESNEQVPGIFQQLLNSWLVHIANERLNSTPMWANTMYSYVSVRLL